MMDTTYNQREPTAISEEPGAVCLLDEIDDDVLIVIFTFLSLYDKIIATWVCRRWRRILQEHKSLWSVINFMSQDQVMRVTFKMDDSFVLDILRSYTSSCTKNVNMPIKNTEGLQHLHERCPEIQRLSLVFNKRNRKTSSTDYNNSVLVPGLVLVGKCTNIKYLYLENVEVDGKLGLDVLKSCSGISELILERTNFVCNRPIELNEILRDTIGVHMTNLATFRFNCVEQVRRPYPRSPFHHIPPAYISGFVESMANWTNLRILALLGDIAFTEDAFCKMVSNLPDIVSLSIHGTHVTNEILRLTTAHLKRLTDLEVADGVYGEEVLDHLQTCVALKTLSIGLDHLCCNKDSSDISKKLHEVICTLPEIERVKIIGAEGAEIGKSITDLKLRNTIEVTKSELRIEW